MKIAVAAEGPEALAQVSSMGGRAPYYLIAEDGKIVEIVKNPFSHGSGGAGFSVAYMLAEKGVELVIAGKIGDKMVQALESRNVGYREAGGQSVSEVLS
ncbi:MAG: NifB/NifX family molybdenum-iron cluster-binding protein [Patescibacteria group bacterium]|nr:NifB/NifX family molybdenum-iron cluster-binding protein [Patescibacteria group bacterium]